MMQLPMTLSKLVNGYEWEQITIGLSESKTFLLKTNNHNQYLKIQSIHAVENLQDEKNRLEWLQGKLPVPKVLHYEKDKENEYLLLSEIKGKDASHQSYETNLPQLMKLLAEGVKMMHGISIKDCPFNEKLEKKIEEARQRVKNGLVDEEDFDDIRSGKTAKQLFQDLIIKKPENEELVFTHGDYCLPNIIMDNDKVSGFIDMGRAGVADRHQDLALAIRSIRYNFGEEMVPFFLNEYGFEVDETKIKYYQLLDEFY
jgi:kanamycin kinase/aminoglycoside 3'-phosphotransferase-2